MFLKVVRHYCAIKHTNKTTACKYLVRFAVVVCCQTHSQQHKQRKYLWKGADLGYQLGVGSVVPVGSVGSKILIWFTQSDFEECVVNHRIIQKSENPLIATSSPMHRENCLAEKIGSVLVIRCNSWNTSIQTTLGVINLIIYPQTAVIAVVLFRKKKKSLFPILMYTCIIIYVYLYIYVNMLIYIPSVAYHYFEYERG